jgi:AraC-like DNA-binding protein
LLERTGRSASTSRSTSASRRRVTSASRFRREFGVTPRAIRRDARRLDADLDA